MSQPQTPLTTYEVVKDELFLPCPHPYCSTLHRRLYNADLNEEQTVLTYNPRTDEVTGSYRTSRYHELTRIQWIILRDGVRVGDAHPTKREALREVLSEPTI